MKNKNFTFILLLSGFVWAGFAQAGDYGDYSSWRTFLYNMGWKSPPSANYPVRSSDLVGDYPLVKLQNKSSDGFSPKKYHHWQLVTLESGAGGASCIDGSPYRFVVRRSPSTSNIVVEYEGGGACWDYDSCANGEGLLSASNMNGIPDDYHRAFDEINLNVLEPWNWPGELVKFFSSVQESGIRVFATSPIYNKWTATYLGSGSGFKSTPPKTVDWTVVYAPYCTGDVHLGDGQKVYWPDEWETAETFSEQMALWESGVRPFVADHKGIRNQRAIASWIKDNLPRPGQMLLHGVSAGGTGALAGMINRRDINPRYAYMINDSGPMMLADRRIGFNEVDDPSANLHRTISDSWELDKLYDYVINDYTNSAEADPNNYGTINGVLADAFPQDRFGFTTFKRDEVFSRFSYQGHAGYQEAETNEERLEFLFDLWEQDVDSMERYLNRFPNYGFFNMGYRSLISSHTTTSFTFLNSDIEELGLSMGDWFWNIMNGKLYGGWGEWVMSASEQNIEADYNENVCLFCSGSDNPNDFWLETKEWAFNQAGSLLDF